jgi:hypothetical protein
MGLKKYLILLTWIVLIGSLWADNTTLNQTINQTAAGTGNIASDAWNGFMGFINIQVQSLLKIQATNFWIIILGAILIFSGNTLESIFKNLMTYAKYALIIGGIYLIIKGMGLIP